MKTTTNRAESGKKNEILQDFVVSIVRYYEWYYGHKLRTPYELEALIAGFGDLLPRLYVNPEFTEEIPRVVELLCKSRINDEHKELALSGVRFANGLYYAINRDKKEIEFFSHLVDDCWNALLSHQIEPTL